MITTKEFLSFMYSPPPPISSTPLWLDLHSFKTRSWNVCYVYRTSFFLLTYNFIYNFFINYNNVIWKDWALRDKHFQFLIRKCNCVWAKIYWNLIWKNPGFVPFGASLTQFVANPAIVVEQLYSNTSWKKTKRKNDKTERR